MKNIVFYISDHGFGHMSRNLPIIRQLLKEDESLFIHIKCGKTQLAFAKSNLTDYKERIACYAEQMDIGLILKPGTLLVDKPALTAAVKAFTDTWEERIRKEVHFLRSRHIEKAVVDIPAFALKACKLAGVSSLFISNFTWAEVYQEYLPHKLWQKYLSCYQLADKALLYDLYAPVMETYFQRYEKTGFLCRQFHEEAAASIRAKHTRPLVFVSTGRSAALKDEPFVGDLPYDFLLTDGVKLTGDNVYHLPPDTVNTQDYILASDYCIIKAGWGTISEGLLAGKKMALLSRNTVAEDRNSIALLKERGLAIEISADDLNHMEKVLHMLEETPAPTLFPVKDCTSEVAAAIQRLPQ